MSGSSSLEGTAFQILESIEADFGEMTWTFRIGAGNRVCAGHYAVMPSSRFMDMSGKLAHAEGLLRQMLDGDQTDLKWRERVMRYFDPGT